jgi:hypothetical protein
MAFRFSLAMSFGIETKHGPSYVLVKIKHQHFGSWARDKAWPFPCIPLRTTPLRTTVALHPLCRKCFRKIKFQSMRGIFKTAKNLARISKYYRIGILLRKYHFRIQIIVIKKSFSCGKISF